MMHRANPMDVLILGDSKLLLFIIVVNMFSYFFHRLSDASGVYKVKIIRRLFSMGSFNHTHIYTNPDQNGIQPHIAGNNIVVELGVCALIIYLDAIIGGFVL